jgi:hypothetical protein
MESARTPGDFAVVSTPGDRWFSLEVRGGYSADRFEEGLSNDQVTRVLEHLVQLGAAYLAGSRRIVRSRLLKVPAIVVNGTGGSTTLRLSLPGTLKYLIGKSADDGGNPKPGVRGSA